jgi:hypothetical protein
VEAAETMVNAAVLWTAFRLFVKTPSLLAVELEVFAGRQLTAAPMINAGMASALLSLPAAVQLVNSALLTANAVALWTALVASVGYETLVFRPAAESNAKFATFVTSPAVTFWIALVASVGVVVGVKVLATVAQRQASAVAN